ADEWVCGGLPAGMSARLFNPYVQVGVDRSGFGLGLAIVKQVAERRIFHKGEALVHVPDRFSLAGSGMKAPAAFRTRPGEVPALDGQKHVGSWSRSRLTV